MAILHYVIGLPPVRRGGSVQYANDLMREQSKTEKVYALICGETLLRENHCRIRYRGKDDEIEVYSLENPLTPTLIYGVSNPAGQHREIDIDYENIRKFIESNDIRVLHIHTLMGLHKNVVEYIKTLGVRVVYTTHDFHGVCPHYNLIDFEGKICSSANGIRCSLCNINEPGEFFLRCVNSRLYQRLKANKLLKLLKKRIAGSGNAVDIQTDNMALESDAIRSKEFDGLLNYYKSYFALIDCFHFNSKQTRDVFTHFIPDVNGCVIPIVTSGIKDLRQAMKPGPMIKLGFIGSLNDYKGFPRLKKVFMDILSGGINNLRLLVYSDNPPGEDTDCARIQYMPSYRYDELTDVMGGLDCIIVPSKWYETFSLVTLEAISRGRPVIVSDHVGAQDVVKKVAPDMVFHSEEELKAMLIKIATDSNYLTKTNNAILNMDWKYSMNMHALEMLNFYEKI